MSRFKRSNSYILTYSTNKKKFFLRRRKYLKRNKTYKQREKKELIRSASKQKWKKKEICC